MIEEQIEIRMSDGTADGFLYRPDGDGRHPGVLHLTDAGGVRPSHRAKAQRLAEQGYVVLLPNIFYRTSRSPVFDFTPNFGDERTRTRFMELVTPLTPEAMERDASTYVDFLAAHAAVSDGPMGAVGHCFTGAMALRSAAARPDKIAAVASFHGGGLVTDTLTSPHLVLPRVKARLYFGHAIDDTFMPKEAIEALERALEVWGGRCESETYDGAYHGWTVSDAPSYNAPQADRAFEKLTALLAETLK